MRTSGGDVCPVAQASILTAIANTIVRHSFRERCVDLTAESSLSACIGVPLHAALGHAPAAAVRNLFTEKQTCRVLSLRIPGPRDRHVFCFHRGSLIRSS